MQTLGACGSLKLIFEDRNMMFFADLSKLFFRKLSFLKYLRRFNLLRRLKLWN